MGDGEALRGLSSWAPTQRNSQPHCSLLFSPHDPKIRILKAESCRARRQRHRKHSQRGGHGNELRVGRRVGWWVRQDEATAGRVPAVRQATRCVAWPAWARAAPAALSCPTDSSPPCTTHPACERHPRRVQPTPKCVPLLFLPSSAATSTHLRRLVLEGQAVAEVGKVQGAQAQQARHQRAAKAQAALPHHRALPQGETARQGWLRLRASRRLPGLSSPARPGAWCSGRAHSRTNPCCPCPYSPAPPALTTSGSWTTTIMKTCSGRGKRGEAEQQKSAQRRAGRARACSHPQSAQPPSRHGSRPVLCTQPADSPPTRHGAPAPRWQRAQTPGTWPQSTRPPSAPYR